MVAIVILTMTLIASYSWINISIQMLIRVDEVMSQELLLDELLEEIYLTDLDTTRSGQLSRGGLSATWEARPIESKSSRNLRDRIGFYDHTLYGIEISVSSETAEIGAWTTRRVTSRRVRDPSIEL